MFQTDGIFDFNKYAGYLRGTLRIEPMLFEEEVRENVLTRLAMGALSPLSFISAAEERDFELMRHEQIDLECAVFENAAQSVSREEIRDEDLRRYFAENRTAFFVPVRRKIRFVLMPYDAASGLPEAGEQELRAYFDANVQLFSDPSGTPARFEDRRGAVAQALKLQRQKESVRESARKLFYRLVQQDSGAEQAVAQAGYEISESAAFSQENPEPLRPVFGADDALVAREAFKAGLQGWSSPLALSGGVVLLMPVSEDPAREPSFEEAPRGREKIFAASSVPARPRTGAETGRVFGPLRRDGVSRGGRLGRGQVRGIPPFSMLAPPVVPHLGEQDVLALFALPAGKTSGLIALSDGFLVARVRGYKTPPPETRPRSRRLLPKPPTASGSCSWKPLFRSWRATPIFRRPAREDSGCTRRGSVVRKPRLELLFAFFLHLAPRSVGDRGLFSSSPPDRPSISFSRSS
jgi:hypothetical protein